MTRKIKRARRMEVAFEFLLFGLVFGIIEDIIAVKVTTGEAITLQVFGIIVLIAIPFAILGELVADNVDFVKLFRRLTRKAR